MCLKFVCQLLHLSSHDPECKHRDGDWDDGPYIRPEQGRPDVVFIVHRCQNTTVEDSLRHVRERSKAKHRGTHGDKSGRQEYHGQDCDGVHRGTIPGHLARHIDVDCAVLLSDRVENLECVDLLARPWSRNVDTIGSLTKFIVVSFLALYVLSQFISHFHECKRYSISSDVSLTFSDESQSGVLLSKEDLTISVSLIDISVLAMPESIVWETM